MAEALPPVSLGLSEANTANLPLPFPRPWVAGRADTRVVWSSGQFLLPGEDHVAQARHDLRIFLGDIVELGEVVFEIVKLDATAIGVEQEFPVSFPNGQHGTLVKWFAGDVKAPFPQERFGAGAGMAQEDIAGVFAIRFVDGRNFDACEAANCG